MKEKKRGGGTEDVIMSAPTRKVTAMADLVAELLVREEDARTGQASDTGPQADRAALEASRLISVGETRSSRPPSMQPNVQQNARPSTHSSAAPPAFMSSTSSAPPPAFMSSAPPPPFVSGPDISTELRLARSSSQKRVLFIVALFIGIALGVIGAAVAFNR